jgi:hypothetical protein
MGCAVASDKAEITPSPSHNISADPSVTPTNMPQPLSPTPTILPVVPTLPNEEAYSLLLNMLNPNGTCELPCWLNVTPGKSSLAEAYFAWAPLQGITATVSDFPATNTGSMDFIYKMDNYNLKIFTNYSVSPSNEMIESIEVFTELTHQLGNDQLEYSYTAEIYKKTLSAFLLPNILSTYGLPDRILLDMEIITAEPASPDFFHIWLLYPERGAIIEYTGSAVVRNSTIHGCPSDTIMSLWLVSPESSELYQATLEQVMGLLSSPFYKSTEDAIGMTAEKFYDEFKKPDGGCIESPLDIWPQR